MPSVEALPLSAGKGVGLISLKGLCLLGLTGLFLVSLVRQGPREFIGEIFSMDEEDERGSTEYSHHHHG